MSKIILDTRLITKDDESFIVDDVRLVTFRNNGQSRAWIDEQVVLDPKEEYSIGVEAPDFFSHTFRIRFIELGAGSNVLGTRSTIDKPPVDLPLIYAGNRISVTILKPKPNA